MSDKTKTLKDLIDKSQDLPYPNTLWPNIPFTSDRVRFATEMRLSKHREWYELGIMLTPYTGYTYKL